MAEITFRIATKKDSEFMAPLLRSADVREITATGHTPLLALEGSRLFSDIAYTGLINGVPAMMFGCGEDAILNEASVWALGTDLCTKHPREMLKYGRRKVQEMLDIYPAMENYCDARYKAAHRWLKKLGFTILDPVPYGKNGELFCKISIRKEI